MPNWCSNDIVIYGNHDNLFAFYKAYIQEKVVQEDKKYKVWKEENPNAGVLETANFIAYVQKDDVLSTFFPCPDEYLSQKGFNSGGYEWCLQNWGTKWSESSTMEVTNNWAYSDGTNKINKIYYSFDTPWGPPIDGYKKISEKFPELYFTHFYSEPLMDFAGGIVYHNGEDIYNNELDNFCDLVRMKLNMQPDEDITPQNEGTFYDTYEDTLDKVREDLVTFMNFFKPDLSKSL